MARSIVILGSGRSKGNTWKAVEEIVGGVGEERPEVVDLREVNISGFDYEQRNSGDDYKRLMDRVLEKELMVLATPMYWYNVSAQMKVFVDRLSDLMCFDKEKWERLKGKELYMVVTYGGLKGPDLIDEEFRRLSEYVGMRYRGVCSYHSGVDEGLLKRNKEEVERARLVMKG